VQVSIQRPVFNELVEGHIADWRRAFESGQVKASGQEGILKLIVNVVERQEERSRLRRARH